MSAIHVCSMAKVPDTIASAGAQHLLTLLSPSTEFMRPASIMAENHLHLVMHDILADEDGARMGVLEVDRRALLGIASLVAVQPARAEADARRPRRACPPPAPAT